MDKKPNDTLKTAKRLLDVVLEQKFKVVLILIAAIGYSVLTIIAPMLSSHIIDLLLGMVNSGVEGGLQTVVKTIGVPLLGIAIVYMLVSLFSFMQEYFVSSLSETTTLSLRKKVSHKLNKSKLETFDANPVGETLSRLTNDMERISEALQTSVIQLITSIFTVIGSVVMMMRMSVLLTVIAMISIIASIYITMIVSRKSLIYATERQEKLGDLNSQIEEKYTGRVIIKAFNREVISMSEVEEANDKLYNANVKADFFTHAINPVIRFVNRIGYVLVAIMSGYLYIQGTMSVGNIQAFIQYISQVTEPLTQASFGVNSLQSALASAKRVFEVIDADDEVKDIENAMSPDVIRGDLELKNVTFGYGEKNLMENVNLSIKAGEMVAIVGPTGAGKTTLVNILMRFYEIRGGSITIDGININEFKRRDLRKRFGMVLQDSWLFEGTVAENLSYGKPEARLEEIIETTKLSQSDHFIRTLPNGYQSILNSEGSSLSSGQKQLLTIARAMLTDPAILILDEATSSVDTRTESEIQGAMNQLMKGRTSLVIAHRLSTIRNADKILVMNHGTIVEQGTHEELMSQKGFYENLYNSQFAN